MPTKKKEVTPVAKKKVATKKVVAKKQATVEPEVHRKYVLLGVCSSCDHLPLRANKLVMLLSLVIFVLSGMLISISAPLDIDFQLSWVGGGPIQMDNSLAQTK